MLENFSYDRSEVRTRASPLKGLLMDYAKQSHDNCHSTIRRCAKAWDLFQVNPVAEKVDAMVTGRTPPIMLLDVSLTYGYKRNCLRSHFGDGR